MQLSHTAAVLEKAGREADTNAIISKTPAFIEAIESLIDEMKSGEENNDAEISSQDTSFLKEKLLVIKTSCEELDKKTAKNVISDLTQKTWPNAINTVIDNISTFLLHSEFNKAAEEASELSGTL